MQFFQLNSMQNFTIKGGTLLHVGKEFSEGSLQKL